MHASTSFAAILLSLAVFSASRTAAADPSPSDSSIADSLVLTPSPPRDPTLRTRVFLDGYEVLPIELDKPLDVRGKGHSLVVKPIDERTGAPADDDWTGTIDVEGLQRQIANYSDTPRRDHVAFFAIGASLHIGAIGPGIVAFIPEMTWSLAPPRGMRDDGGGR